MAEIRVPVLTLDISSKCIGWAFKAPRASLKVGHFEIAGKDLIRAVIAGDAFAGWAVQHDISRGVEIWVEQPFYSKGGSHDLPIKMTHGTILSALYHRVYQFTRGKCFYWNYVNVNTWRCPMLKGKHAPKSEDKKRVVMEEVEKLFGIKPANNDEGDALGIYAWYLKEKHNAL